MMPPICARMATDETGRTCPTGAGSTNTGTFVTTTLAVKTGAAGAPLETLLREQPAARWASAKTIKTWKNNFISGRSAVAFEDAPGEKWLQIVSENPGTRVEILDP